MPRKPICTVAASHAARSHRRLHGTAIHRQGNALLNGCQTAASHIQAPAEVGCSNECQGPNRQPAVLFGARGDFGNFVQAECGDVLFSSASQRVMCISSSNRPEVMGRGSSTTGSGCLHTGGEVRQDPSRYVLNHINTAVWIPILGTLQTRGAIQPKDYPGIARFVPPKPYKKLFPWLWMTEHPVPVSKVTRFHSPAVESNVVLAAAPPPSTMASRPCSTSLAVSSSIHFLRVAAPAQWCSIIDVILQPVRSAAELSAKEGLSLLAKWHQVLFALSAHPVFCEDRERIQQAHDYLMSTISSYYADAVRVQTQMSGDAESCGDRADTPSSPPNVLTRMPPLLARKWRALYAEQMALPLYAQWFQSCVEGEEAILRCITVKHNAPSASGKLDVPPCMTALLLDEELFEFFISIPGRKECDYQREVQWERTLSVARFAFRCLFRMLIWRQRRNGSDLAVDPLTKAVTVFMNVCMYVMNDNQEGKRCAEGIRCIMTAYYDVLDEMSATGSTECCPLPFKTAWDMLHLLRRTSMDCMAAKSERLRHGPSKGLFDVCIIAASIDIFRPPADTGGGDVAVTRQDVEIVLHACKAPDAVWAALRRHPRALGASRYALIVLGKWLLEQVLCAASTAGPVTARRLLGELREWCARMGQPLHLFKGEAESIWDFQFQRAPNGAILRATWERLVQPTTEGSVGSAVLGWQCGCGFAQRPSSSLFCASCVCQSLVPCSWVCPKCHWHANTGEPLPYCLQCGAQHPSRWSSTISSAIETIRWDQFARGGGAPTCEHRHTHELATLAAIGSVCQDCGVVVHSDGKHPVVQQMHKPVEALCYSCDACHAYSVSGGSNEVDGRPETCTSCGVTNEGHHVAYFTWKCGCGASNNPTHTHCWACTASDAAAVAEARGRKIQGAQTLVRPLYTCSDCWHAVVVDGMKPTACTRCHSPHPRTLASVASCRLMSCPDCGGLLPFGCSVCPHCSAANLGEVQHLLATEADQPWMCHSCGYQHPARMGNGTLLPPSSLPTEDKHMGEQWRGGPGRSKCASCGISRIAVALWECGRQWTCEQCGECSNAEPACRRCLALHGAIPQSEVHLWRCGVCQVTLNPSWTQICTLRGCGGKHTATVAQYRYSPWMCNVCGGFSRSAEVGTCETCLAPAPSELPPSSSIRTTPVAEEAKMDLQLPRESIESTYPSPSPDGDLSGVGVDTAQQALPSCSPITITKKRLDTVEDMLLLASQDVPDSLGLDATHLSVHDAHTHNTSGTGASDANIGTGTVSYPSIRADVTYADTGEAWERAYSKAVLSF